MKRQLDNMALSAALALVFFSTLLTTSCADRQDAAIPERPLDGQQGAAVSVEEWSSFAGQKAGDLRVIEINGVPFRFRWCPPGSFVMGSPVTERDRRLNEVPHEVTLSHGFWMLETETTQLMWESIMGRNPSGFKGANLPVDYVSWNDCQEFIAKLNDRGYAPAGARFSLPTEAQWEYACRAGTTSPFFWGDSLNGDKANCDGNFPYGIEVKGKRKRLRKKGKSLKKTAPVGSYVANPWGLFDMHGNVREWCEDYYDDYPSGAVTDPHGPESGSVHAVRGGSWVDCAKFCRSAYRFFFSVDYRGEGGIYCYGFRLTLVSRED